MKYIFILLSLVGNAPVKMPLSGLGNGSVFKLSRGNKCMHNNGRTVGLAVDYTEGDRAVADGLLCIFNDSHENWVPGKAVTDRLIINHYTYSVYFIQQQGVWVGSGAGESQLVAVMLRCTLQVLTQILLLNDYG
jgi:hypothetical protein